MSLWWMLFLICNLIFFMFEYFYFVSFYSLKQKDIWSMISRSPWMWSKTLLLWSSIFLLSDVAIWTVEMVVEVVSWLNLDLYYDDVPFLPSILSSVFLRFFSCHIYCKHLIGDCFTTHFDQLLPDLLPTELSFSQC